MTAVNLRIYRLLKRQHPSERICKHGEGGGLVEWSWEDRKGTYSGWSRSSAGSWWTCCRDGAPRAPVLSLGSSILCSGCSIPSLKRGSGWDSVPPRPHSHTSYAAREYSQKRTTGAHAGTHGPCGCRHAASSCKHGGAERRETALKSYEKWQIRTQGGPGNIWHLLYSADQKSNWGTGPRLWTLVSLAQYENIMRENSLHGVRRREHD